MYTMCTALLTVGNTSQSERWREEGEEGGRGVEEVEGERGWSGVE